MDPRFFNFRSGTWEVEWERVRAGSGVRLPVESRPVPVSCDYHDLLLIKELQKNALQHVVGMAHELKVHVKTFEYHYRTHVTGKRLIWSYIVRWARDIEKCPAHSVATTRLTFGGLSRKDFETIQWAVSRIPFLWAEELLRDGTYIATVYAPLTEMMGMFGYPDEEVSDLDTKVEVGFVKAHEACAYTMPHHMFIGGEWKFDLDQAGSVIEECASSGLEK